MDATTEQIETLVDQCSRLGRSFGSVRREHGDEIYRAVRDECGRRGRGTLVLYDVEQDAAGNIRGSLNPQDDA